MAGHGGATDNRVKRDEDVPSPVRADLKRDAHGIVPGADFDSWKVSRHEGAGDAEVLRARKAALVIHDMIPAHPWVFTADWTYIRFHGPGRGHGQSYSEEMLDEAAQRVRESTVSGLDVYAFFNNDAEGHALMNARRLGELVSESFSETGGSEEES